MNQEKKNVLGMSLIVKTIAGYIQGFILLYGLYVIIGGSKLPGGAFPGGVIIAFSFILITLSHGRGIGLRKLTNRRTTILTCIGVLIFLLTAIVGIFIADIFFINLTRSAYSPHPGLIGSYMFLYELAISLLVSMSLILIFSILANWSINRKK